MEIVQKALSAKRESKHVEFKQSFDPSQPGEWCELIKDLAAIANSGGGIIVFGLDSRGMLTGEPIDAITSIDPADIANKVLRYTGQVDFEFEVRELTKQTSELVAFVIPAVAVPLIFEKPGTYEIGGGKQKTAFGVGTVYFRHGAKSEPGTSEDIRRVVERQLDQIRRSWLKGVRKIVQAPQGAHIVALHPTTKEVQQALATNVRAVNDPKATPVRLTRDSSITSGTFVHEEVSSALFDEINNVIDANRILARGQPGFFLGQPVYYRIYAERHHVRQSEGTQRLLLRNGVADFYAPALYWAVTLPAKQIIETLVDLYLYPTNRHVHSLIRIGVLLGADFAQWLHGQWAEKWKRHAQPPSFYFTLKRMLADLKDTDPRLVAARVSLSSKIEIGDAKPVSVRQILDTPERASMIVSAACMKVFEGVDECRQVARDVDYLAYGAAMQRRAQEITECVIKTIGERKPGDVTEAAEVQT
jgi:hypothetical protein